MPTKRRDGFSEDGLSYAVADDQSKLLGQALSDFEARTKNPRGLHESPEEFQRRVSMAPNLLDQELGAIGISMPRSTRQVQPRTYEIGNELVQVDPITGGVKSLFTKKKEGLGEIESLRLKSAYDTRKAILGSTAALTSEGKKRLAEADAIIKSIEGGSPAPVADPIGNAINPQSKGLLPKGMVSQYLQKAGGDRAKAEELAKADGWQTRY